MKSYATFSGLVDEQKQLHYESGNAMIALEAAFGNALEAGAFEDPHAFFHNMRALGGLENETLVFVLGLKFARVRKALTHPLSDATMNIAHMVLGTERVQEILEYQDANKALILASVAQDDEEFQKLKAAYIDRYGQDDFDVTETLLRIANSTFFEE